MSVVSIDDVRRDRAPLALAHPAYHEAWPLERLLPAPDNPRRDLGNLEELAESIRSVGILEPLLATTTPNTGDDGVLVVLAGHRRHAAAVLAGLQEVPVLVHELLDDRARAEIMLVENCQRSDLTPAEEAETYDRLVQLGLTQRELSGRIGRSQSHISKRLGLLALPEDVRVRVGRPADSGGITFELAAELLKLKDHPKILTKVVKVAGADEWGLKQGVADALRGIETEKDRAKATAEAKAKGWKVFDEPSEFRQKTTWERLQVETWQPGLKLSVAAHRKEPCHAIVFHRYDRGRYFDACAQPARHTAKGESSLKVKAAPRTKADGARAKKLAEDRARKAAYTRREEQLRTQLAKRVPAGEALQVLARSILGELDYETALETCRLLGIECGDNRRKAVELLQAKAGTVQELTRIATAAALAVGHVNARHSYHGWDAPDVQVTYEFLRARGYQPEPEEAKLLGAGKK